MAIANAVLLFRDFFYSPLFNHFDVLSMEEYVDIVAECLTVIPPDIVIHRLTGDGPKSLLVAPLWSADKKKVLNYMNHYFLAKNIRQGSAL